MVYQKSYIALGSNLEPRLKTCFKAIKHIKNLPKTSVTKQSSFIETKPIGVLNQPMFLNGVIEIETALSPTQLLKHLKTIERKLGRTPSKRWGPRIIDLDILTYGSLTLDTPKLKIPHPEIKNRKFIGQLLEQF